MSATDGIENDCVKNRAHEISGKGQEDALPVSDALYRTADIQRRELKFYMAHTALKIVLADLNVTA